MKEQQPNSLERSLERQTRLSRIVEQRQHLLDALTAREGKPGIENRVIDLRIEDFIKPRVEASHQRAKASLSQTEAAIAEQGETLVPQAQAYLDNLALYKQVLVKLRERTQNGNYPRELLEQGETELQEYIQRAETDPAIKLGIKLLRERREKEEQTSPTITPLPEAKGVAEILKLPDGQDLPHLSRMERMVVEKLLTSSHTHPISHSELEKLLADDNMSEQAVYTRVMNALHRIRVKLNQVSWKIVNIMSIIERTKGKRGLYYLAPKDEQIIAAKVEVFEVTLPDGQIVRIRSRLRTRALEKLTQTSKDSPVQTDELAITLYGVYNRTNSRKISALIIHLNSEVLEPLSYRVFQLVGPRERQQGQKAKYYLEKIQGEQIIEKTIEGVSGEVEEEEGTVEIAPPPQFPRGFEEIIELPYVPSAEEARSEEETIILEVITSLIIRNNPPNIKIRFEDVISALSSEIKKKSRPIPHSGERLYYIYSATELKDKFTSALRKLREEEALTHLKGLWSENDHKLWDGIKVLVDRLGYGEFDEFIRKVKIEIDNAQKRFDHEYPRSDGKEGPLPWVRG